MRLRKVHAIVTEIADFLEELAPLGIGITVYYVWKPYATDDLGTVLRLLFATGVVIWASRLMRASRLTRRA